MRDTCVPFSKNGLGIITGAGHMPALVRASLALGFATGGCNFAGTAFRWIIGLWPSPSWADYITNTGWKGTRRDSLEGRTRREDPLAGRADFGTAADPPESLVRSAQPYLSGVRPDGTRQHRNRVRRISPRREANRSR